MDDKDEILEQLVADESFIRWIETDDDPKWSEWLAINPEMNDVVENARRVIHAFEFNGHIPAQERIDYLKSSIDDNIILMENQSHSGSTWWSLPMKRAAVLLALLSFMAALYFVLDNPLRPPAVKHAAQYIEKSTHKGQKLTTSLPDGSTVVLNSGSRIVFGLRNNAEDRVVRLEGEAFFDVAEDTLRPFHVVSNGITTTAIGTSFCVNGNRRDNQVAVSLVSGSVEVRNERNESIILNPGEMALAGRASEIEIDQFDYFERIAWKDGILVFTNATFTEIVHKLEDWYGVNIQVQANVGEDFHYTAKYENHTLSEVLQGIAFVQPFEYSIEGDTVEIDFQLKN